MSITAVGVACASKVTKRHVIALILCDGREIDVRYQCAARMGL